MAEKKFLGVMLVMILAFSVGLVGCDNGTTSNGNTDPKTIIITGLAGKNGTVALGIYSTPNDNSQVAAGQGTVSDDTVTISLKNREGNDWTGAGAYYIQIGIGNLVYFYTNGEIVSDEAEIPKYNIIDATSTIAFDQFQFRFL